MNIFKTKSTIIPTLFILAFLFNITGCYKEDALTPSEDEKCWEPLQGDNEHDARIWDWYKKRGIVIRYQFTEEPYIIHEKYIRFHKDTTLYMNTSYSLNTDSIFIQGDSIHIGKEIFKIGKEDNRVMQGFDVINVVRDISIQDSVVHRLEYMYVHNDGINVEPADEKYIGKQLDLLEKVYLNIYPKTGSFKPHTIFLGKNLQEIQNWGNKKNNIKFYIQDFMMILSCGDSTIQNMTGKDITTLKNNLNISALKDRDTPKFTVVNFPAVDYTTKRNYANGFVSTSDIADRKLQYIKMIIRTPYETLIQEPTEADMQIRAESYVGCLHPKKDINGWIRKGYDAIIEDFKAIGIDIQAIGNLVYQ